MAQTTMLTPELDECISACREVVTAASECAMRCLGSENPSEMEDCIRLCLDAVDVSQACVTIASRTSSEVDKICGVTAAITDACADMCDEMAKDEIMKRCADACRRAADLCRIVVGSDRPRDI